MRIVSFLTPIAIVALTTVLGAQAAPAPAGFGDPFTARPLADGPVKVGPARGTVVVVGGGVMGPEIYRAFIDAAGGPDALILVVPNAGGGDVVASTTGRGWREHGASNVAVLFTKDRRLADSDSFTAVIGKAGGVWFDGGRQFHLVQDYGGTRTERAFRELLDRGGVIGGSSAGASILGDFMVRGAPSSDNSTMDYPGYETGFGYLRNVGIDQHVVARSRLPDLADSIVTRYPHLLGISADEGTAWVIRGDTGRIVGRSKAFVYNGSGPTDAGSPFLTLLPGDRYDLNARRVVARARERSPQLSALVDSLFQPYADGARGRATVLVARDGDVYVDRAYGIPVQPRFMPRTTLPQFDLGDIARVYTGLCSTMPRDTASVRRTQSTSALEACVRRISVPIGAHQTAATDSSHVSSSVDELYRLALGLEVAETFPGADRARGWEIDQHRGLTRLAAYASPDGRRAAFVRVPGQRLTIIVLTNDPGADARALAQRILDELVAPHAP